jgi:membrane protease YdiL (CAAX protease family)
MAWQCPKCGKINYDDSVLRCACGARVKRITDADDHDDNDFFIDPRVFTEEHPFIEDSIRQADETGADEPTFPVGEQVESRYDVGVDVFFAIAASFIASIILEIVLPEDALLMHYTLWAIADCGIIWLLYRKYPLKLSEFGSTKNIVRFALVAAYVMFPLYAFFTLDGPTGVPDDYDLYVSYNSYQRLTFFLQLVMVAPVIEEIFFRGYLYRILRMRYGIYSAFAFTAIPWVIAHGFDLEHAFSAFVFVAIYEKTGNLWYCMIVHSMWNLGYYLFHYLS